MKRKSVVTGVLAMIVVAAAAGEGRAQSEWTSYREPATGVSLDFPAIFSVNAGASQRGRGTRFQSDDGKAELWVFELPNEGRMTPASYVRANLQVPSSSLDYSRVTSSFMVVSGVLEGRVFYSRCNFTEGGRGPLHCIHIVYPHAEVRAWDAMVTRMSRSLR